ncbi:hypothetical protein BDB00DRAFT_956999 [Zychaea mexicana]|uniref:uncharacterized protein n=1 Tax=Zychaea mexicana TaxID=64656 RepID=UPI0022FDDA91|nr:uncharacterized protein BDB00DRAFT_956999 [Zychaea mexicana]KAI9493442.1 hypothetical protein BDB00DRAFT_956999 [Zychaea mexicana]
MKGFTSALLFVFAAATTVSAGCSGDIKVTSQGDLDAIQTCKTYQGGITIENVGTNKLTVKGIQSLKGDLIVKDNNALTSLTLDSLQVIDGQMKLDNNKILSRFEPKALIGVRSFEAAVQPALSSIAFPAGLSQADRFMVSDTTAARIDGLKMDKVSNLIIDNNIYLKSVDLSNLTDIGDTLTVSANSPSLNLDLHSLGGVKHGSFRNLAGVNLDGLKHVSGDISFISNTFGKLGLKEISEIDGTLTITNNNQLSELALPKLRRLGGALSVGHNTQLGTIEAFPNLEEVDGTLDIVGTFDEVKLPKLSDVRGGLNVQTSSSKFSCNDMSKLKNGVIKGNSFLCKASVAKPKSGMKGGAGGGLDDMEGTAGSIQLAWFVVTTMSLMGTWFLL